MSIAQRRSSCHNIASLRGTVASTSPAAQLLSSSDNRISHGLDAALPMTLTVTAADSFATLDDEPASYILHVSRFASLHPSFDLVSSMACTDALPMTLTVTTTASFATLDDESV